MSFRNRTGLCGLLIGSSLAMASACGGLSDVKIVINDNGGTGNPSGGDGSSAKGGTGNPNGGGSAADSGTGGVNEGGAGGVLGAGGDQAAGGVGNQSGEGGEGGVFVPPDPMPGPPSVVSVSPTNGATNGEPLGVVRITFSEPLNPATATSANIQIKDSAGAILDGPVTYADGVVTFRPKGRLNLLASYSVNVSAAVTDAGGTAMTRPYMSSFTVRDGVWGRSESPLSAATSGFDRLSALALASDGVGRAIAVWGQVPSGGSANEIYAAQFYEGKGWGTPVKVNTNTVPCSYPSVSMNASGNLIVGWIEVDSSQTQTNSIQVRRNIGGNWDLTSTRVDVASTSPYLLTLGDVTVAMSTTGHSHVVWNGSDYNTSTTTPYNDYGVFARHADAAGTWDAAVTSLTYLQQTVSPGVSAPAIAFDGDGNGFAAYQFATTTTTPAKSSTLVYRYLASSNKWGASAVASTTSDSYPLPVGVATSPAGEAVLSWPHLTAVDATTTNYELMGSHFNKAWNTPVVISTATTTLRSDKTMASIAWTGTTFLVAWSQSGGSSYNAYANEYKSAWGTATIISDGNHSAMFPWLTGDGRGNALAIWYQTSDTAPTTTVFPQDVEFSRFVGTADRWSNPARVSSGVAGYAYTRAATLADGTAVATFQSTARSGKITVVNGLFENDFQ